MTTLNDRPNTALLVVDVQNGVVDGAYNRDGLIANIAALVDVRGTRVAKGDLWSSTSNRLRPPSCSI